MDILKITELETQVYTIYINLNKFASWYIEDLGNKAIGYEFTIVFLTIDDRGILYRAKILGYKSKEARDKDWFKIDNLLK